MGVWRKIGGVFLEFDDEAATTPKKGGAARAKAPTPSELQGEADELLAALEGTPRPRRARAAKKAPRARKVDLLTMDASAVYAAAAIRETANSADKILKMIAGLAAFPPEQQRAMVQALDASDPSWSETEVLEDARARQAALRGHLRAIEQEKSARGATLAARMKEVEETGLRNLNEIDKQIAELSTLREQQVASTAAQVQKFEAEGAALASSGEGARRSITDEINRLSGLMTFFTGSGPTA